MSKPLGPGDRAIVVKANHIENLGKVVRVVRLMKPGDVPAEPPPTSAGWAPLGVHAIEAESLGGPFKVESWSMTRGRTGMTTHLGIFLPHQLKRLDDEDPELDLDRVLDDVPTQTEGFEVLT